jgi:predicted AlkP superfamily pyrophosphatase or phosphodiesterase
MSMFSCDASKEEPYVILLSIDGFRHDYAEKYQAINLQKIANQGTSATSLIPCYPSKTFPNHYAIVTGLYPENHGLVDNYFYDPNRTAFYLANQGENVQDGSWYGGTPLWVLAKQHGLKTAAYFWIGSEAEIKGLRPDDYKNYDYKIKSEDITSQIIDWLKLPKAKRPQLINAYYSIVDKAGHDFGTDSPELESAINEIDQNIGRLRNEIDKLDLPINLVIVSDHGMTNTHYENPIYYENIVDLAHVKHVYRDALLMIYSDDSTKVNQLYDTLKHNETGRYNTYLKREIPPAYHFQNNDRIGDILLVANPPNIFSPKGETNGKGTHGYDPKHKDMHGIFYAIGPNIRTESKINSFENIHLYPMISSLLKIPYDTMGIDGDYRILADVVIE